ncbi:DUF2523 domain-containing protein [Vibrio azureus]|uniref:DUF2523 domain-containing protein n=1 Tax=Vibrio azureus NBRC 104587 TaxID=1219077 RepID=U3AMS2_9VIBR|nr:DUF2523 family protein [Vibrio azureus]AUI86139.1 DUF2523 domain-containing protein [Vibrio azureus]GAD74597.1 hypothetical protein VAZ01S_013_00040 [Vibrio azureus NBRC 104587]
MMEFFEYIANVWATIINYFENIGYFAAQFFIWVEALWIKMKLTAQLYMLRTSFLVAKTLLEDIGFATLFTELFNQLPLEVKYWAHLFKVPEGISLYVNCFTTAIVIRMSR